jgi:hypothetical protein
MVRSEGSQIPQVVAAGTLALGAGLAAAPVVSGRFWGLAPDSAPVVPHLIRVYGLSLVGLGLATLRPGSDPVEMMRVATGVSAGTALAGLLGGMRGRVGARSSVMTVATAGGLAALAASAVREGGPAYR